MSFIRWVVFAALLSSLMGCASEPKIVDRQSYLAEATRRYPGETRERVIAAAQTVLRQSEPRNFEFRDRLNGFTGLRHWFFYAVIVSANGTDKWDFITEEKPGAVEASVTISQEGESAGPYSRQHNRIESAKNEIALYQLFWRRVDYVLRRSNHWMNCKEAWQEQDDVDRQRTALLGLCHVSLGDMGDKPPPPQLPPLSPEAGTPPRVSKR